MTKLPKVKGFALDYHLTWSKSYYYLVERPLSSLISFKFESWNGRTLPKNKICHKELKNPLLFFQYPPPEELYSRPDIHLIWVPMWDHVRHFTLDWWRKLPKTIKIVAFSKNVFNMAKKFGFPRLHLQYYKNPRFAKPASFHKKRVLFYWNRIGMLDRKTLMSLCQALQIDKLIFQSTIDPKISTDCHYLLPEQFGSTIVEDLPQYLPRNIYLKKLQQANIYIAPRFYEGVGISFIEALSRGCLVFAYNNPTMNEYIKHLFNGYLINYLNKSRHFNNLMGKLFYHTRLKFYFDKRNTLNLNFREISKLEIKKLGQNAREKSIKGYKKWKDGIKKYASFILT